MRALLVAAFIVFCAPVLAQDFPVTIDHDNGTVTLDAPAERIIVISEEFLEVFVAMDVGPVGFGSWRNEPGDAPFTKLPYLDKPVPGSPTAFDGLEPNFEQVLALDPDLIFYHMDANEPQVEEIAQFETIAPVVAIVGSKPGAWKEVAMALGLATGKMDVATKAIADFEARVAELQTQMAPIVTAHPTVTVVFGVGASSGYFDERFSIGGHFALLGFDVVSPMSETIPASGFGPASAETVTQIDADTIFVIRGGESPFDDLLKRRPQPVMEEPLPKGIGHSGPYAEMLYLEAIAAKFTAQYGQ